MEDRLGQYIKRYLVVGWEETLHTYFDSLPVSKLQTLHLKLHDSKVVAYPNRIFRQIIHQGRTCFFRLIGTIQCRCLHTLFGQLCLDIERPQAVYLVAEEIQSIRVVVRVTIHVHDSTSDGILARLIDEVHTLKT